jgi:hypothetical protein
MVVLVIVVVLMGERDDGVIPHVETLTTLPSGINTVDDILEHRKLNSALRSMEENDLDLYHELSEGTTSREIKAAERGGFTRCKIVHTEPRMSDLLDLETIKAGETASRDECFNACDADVRCKQAVHRHSKGSSTCFPMSVVSEPGDKRQEEEGEFATLVCDTSGAKKVDVVPSMKKTYLEYRKIRARQEDSIKSQLLELGNKLKAEGKDEMMDAYKVDTEAVLANIQSLQGRAGDEMDKYEQEREKHVKLEGTIAKLKTGVFSSRLHMILWLGVASVGGALTLWLLLRPIK